MNATADYLDLPDARLAALGIHPEEIREAIEEAIRMSAAGRLSSAPKSALVPGEGRYLMTTLSTADEPPLTVVKAVTVAPDNPALGLPTINGTILVLDSATGLLKAVLGANWITAVRTAGLSAVAAKRLADPRSASIGFVGSGVQASSHFDAFRELFPIASIRVFGRGQANIDRLCAEAEAAGVRAKPCATALAAVDGADLVVSSLTITYDGPPLIDANWLKPGAFATITDLAIPWDADSLACFDTIVIDDHQQEAASPKRMVPAERVTCDLRELVCGETTAGWSNRRRAAFVFRGLALGDFAAAALAYRRAAGQRPGNVSA